MRAAAKKVVFVATALLMSLAVVEGALHLIVTRHGHIRQILGKAGYYLVPFDRPVDMPDVVPRPGLYRVYHPALGWAHGARGSSPPLMFSDAHGARITETQFAAGFLTPRDPDVVCVGDSFTHGDDVRAEEAWPHVLEELTGRRVVNLGVGGYGIDQAILRWQESGVTPSTVLLGLVPADMERATRIVYNFDIGGLKSKPIFVFDKTGRASIANQPAIHGNALAAEFARGAESELFRLDWNYDRRLFQQTRLDWLYLYRIPRSAAVWRARRHPPIYFTPGPRFDFAMRVLDHGREIAARRKTRFVVVLLHTDFDHGTDGASWELFRRELDRRGTEYIDPTDALYAMAREDRWQVINRVGRHYTPAAHRKVAETVAEWLRAH